MKAILFITSRPIVGGAQKWTYEQAKLIKDDFNVYSSTAWEGWLSRMLKPLCKDILIDEGLYKYYSLPYFIKLIKFIKKNKIDTIVASSASAGMYARLVKIFFPKLYIIYVSHGWSSIYKGNKILQIIEKILSMFTSKILVISKSDYAKAVELIKIKPNKLVMIENSIYPFRIIEKSSSTKRFVLVMVARFESPKRQDLLIRVAKRMNDIKIVLVGDGKNLEEMKKLAPDNVEFLGASDDVEDILNQADAFVLLSDSEGMPLSVLEAMSVKKPLILSNLESLREFIDGNGVLVENNVEDVIEGINQLRHGKYVKMGEDSFNMFNIRYNILNNKNKYLELYEGSTCRSK